MESSPSLNLNSNLVISSKKIHKPIFLEDLPPPKPLITKTFHPSNPAIHIGKVGFLDPKSYIGKELITKQGKNNQYPIQEYTFETKFRHIFTSRNLVYVRDDRFLNPSYFNRNDHNLSHLFTISKLFETTKTYKSPYYTDKTVKSFLNPELSCENLVFESRFESGNLSMASKVSDTEYNLLLQMDTNSLGNTQWFYYRVTNMKTHIKYKFNIINLCKKQSLYIEGMKICIYSERNYQENSEGWFRGGEKIVYLPNGIMRSSFKSYFTLSFEYVFLYEDDCVFFAYAVPFTYTDLIRSLDEFEKDPRLDSMMIRKPVCKTISGNVVYQLTITSPGTREELLQKKAIVLLARAHPGETVASHAMLSLLNFLTGFSTDAHILRSRYIFKIIPMMNPDGVINGNYRCSLLGVDLNRRWQNPDKIIHPEIYYAKKFIESVHKKFKVALLADLHGHSIKKNIFIYGCNYIESPHLCKIFPYLLSKNSNFIYYPDCRFVMQKNKETTLRVSLFRQLRITHVYTVEISFCGGNFGKYKNMHYTYKAIKEFSEEFCKGLLKLEDCLTVPRRLNDVNTENKHNKKISIESEASVKSSETLSVFQKNIGFENFSNIFTEFINNENLLKSGEIEDSGSESDPSEDNIPEKKLIKTFRAKNLKSPKKQPLISASSKVLSKSRCKKCGKYDFPDHICILNTGKSPIKPLNIVTKIVESREDPIKKRSRIAQTPGILFKTIKNKMDKDNKQNGYNGNKTFIESSSERSFIRLGLVSKSPYADGKGIVFKDKSYEKVYEQINRSFSPMPGVHLVGIIEGVSCNLASMKQKPSLSRKLIKLHKKIAQIL